MVRIVSLSVLLTLIIILGLTFFQVLAPFLLPLFLAGVFAILCQPLYRYFLRRTENRVRLAAALTTGATVSIILLPLAVITALSSLQLYAVSTRLSDRDWTRTFRERSDPVLEHVADFMNSRLIGRRGDAAVEDEAEVAIEEPSEPAAAERKHAAALTDAAEADAGGDEASPTPPVPHDATSGSLDAETLDHGPDEVTVVEYTPARLRAMLKERARTSLLSIGGKSLGVAGRTISGTLDVLSGTVFAIVGAVVGFLVFVIALYYFFADGTALLSATEKLIPVHAEYQREILDQFARVVRSVVMATLFAALVQGFATVFALWLFGFEHLLVLLVLCILSALIPMMGTWLVWGPCALWLMWNEHWIQASLLALYGVVVVGMLDNVVRTYVLNSDTKLHPLLALISVLGGLQAMGLWGMFIGPIVASCLHALVKIFNHELSAFSQERFADVAGVSAGSFTNKLPPAPGRQLPAPADESRTSAAPRPGEAAAPNEKQSAPAAKPSS